MQVDSNQKPDTIWDAGKTSRALRSLLENEQKNDDTTDK
jgi:hypothetical protein